MTGEVWSNVRVDFTGDFGPHIGLPNTAINSEGLIVDIVADLE
jgi:hypothetical protein